MGNIHQRCEQEWKNGSTHHRHVKYTPSFIYARQTDIDVPHSQHIFNSMKIMNSTSIDSPVVEGGILKEKCDHAFWCAFKEYRDEAYMKFMEDTNQLDYVLERNEKFPCVTIPWHI